MESKSLFLKLIWTLHLLMHAFHISTLRRRKWERFTRLNNEAQTCSLFLPIFFPSCFNFQARKRFPSTPAPDMMSIPTMCHSSVVISCFSSSSKAENVGARDWRRKLTCRYSHDCGGSVPPFLSDRWINRSNFIARMMDLPKTDHKNHKY